MTPEGSPVTDANDANHEHHTNIANEVACPNSNLDTKWYWGLDPPVPDTIPRLLSDSWASMAAQFVQTLQQNSLLCCMI